MGGGTLTTGADGFNAVHEYWVAFVDFGMEERGGAFWEKFCRWLTGCCSGITQKNVQEVSEIVDL
jgi:hypothetical protein